MLENQKREAKSSDVTVDLNVNGFPATSWEEWREDCQLRFRGSYWTKMYSDHLRAKDMEYLIQANQTQFIASLVEQIEELKSKVEMLERKPIKEEKKVVQLMGGVVPDE